MARRKYSKEEIAKWRDAHRNVFYFNTDDTNFVIPKAYTFGFTLNWAHPLSWLVGAAIIGLLVYSFFFTTPA